MPWYVAIMVIVRVALVPSFAFAVVVFLRPDRPPCPCQCQSKEENQLSSPPLSLLSLHYTTTTSTITPHRQLLLLLPLSSSFSLCYLSPRSGVFLSRVTPSPAPSGPHRLVGFFSTARSSETLQRPFSSPPPPDYDHSNQPTSKATYASALEPSPCFDPSNLQPTSFFFSSSSSRRRRLHLARSSHRITLHRRAHRIAVSPPLTSSPTPKSTLPAPAEKRYSIQLSPPVNRKT